LGRWRRLLKPKLIKIKQKVKGRLKIKSVFDKEDEQMEFRSAIVDETGWVMFWCDELQGEEQIECILESHPEWSRKYVEL